MPKMWSKKGELMKEITLNKCRTYNDKLHLEHICSGSFEKCWRRALNKTELKLYMEIPNTAVVNKELYEDLPDGVS